MQQAPKPPQLKLCHKHLLALFQPQDSANLLLDPRRLRIWAHLRAVSLLLQLPRRLYHQPLYSAPRDHSFHRLLCLN